MVRHSPKRSSPKSTGRSLQHMSPEAKVNLGVDMVSIRKRHPGISKKKLFQLTRRRLQKRPPIRMEEAVPFFAEAGRPKLSDLIGRWKMTNRDTEEVLKGLKRFWSRWAR